MTERDVLGRRRAPGQSRGLRPMHPVLPRGVESRSVRVAMTERAWAELEVAVRVSSAATAPRAIGRVLEAALENASWRGSLQWQIRKEQQLLERAS